MEWAGLPVPDLLGCPRCRRLLREPVTAACGHSLCRRCAPGPGCPLCCRPLPRPGALRVNVLLSGLLERFGAAGSAVAPGPLNIPEAAPVGVPHTDTPTQHTAPSPGTGTPDTGNLNTGIPDTQTLDTGTTDTGILDTRSLDTGTADTGIPDTRSLDTWTLDTGTMDTGILDTRTTDTGIPDTRSLDTGTLDTRTTDTGISDTGSLDTGILDTGITDAQSPGTQTADMEPLESTTGGEWTLSSRTSAQVGLPETGQRLDAECERSPADLKTPSVETGCRQTSLTPVSRGGQRLVRVEERATNQPANEWSKPGSVGKHVPDSSPPLCPALPELSVSDFDCSLCTRLLFEPVTTPCGHTFCRKCIERCLDYRPSCPLCKENLLEFLEQRPFQVTHLLHSLIGTCFSTESAERRQVNLLEMSELSDLRTNVPIFVCTVAFPGISCPLHVFEPHYRLMMRRCQETGTRTFGMCQFHSDKGFSDYGCMLKIQRTEELPDGRSLIDAVGGRRFKVLRRSQRDGYNTADIEYLEDEQIKEEELAHLQRFHNQVYQKALQWYQHLPYFFQERILTRHGPIPGMEENLQVLLDGPRWCWWFLAAVPIQPTLQTLMLSTTSLNDRLFHLQRILKYLDQNELH